MESWEKEVRIQSDQDGREDVPLEVITEFVKSVALLNATQRKKLCGTLSMWLTEYCKASVLQEETMKFQKPE